MVTSKTNPKSREEAEKIVAGFLDDFAEQEKQGQSRDEENAMNEEMGAWASIEIIWTKHMSKDCKWLVECYCSKRSKGHWSVLAQDPGPRNLRAVLDSETACWKHTQLKSADRGSAEEDGRCWTNFHDGRLARYQNEIFSSIK